MQIKDRVFLITGGGQGLGAQTAQQLQERGARVVLADVNADSGEAMAKSLGEQAIFVRTDVTAEADAVQAVAQAVAHFGRLDGLVNCAGIAPGEKIVGREGPHRLDSFARAININLIGTFNMLRLAADAMSKQPAGANGERGVIINTASIAAYEGQIGQAAYAASKAGIVGLTLPVARELARSGIRCMTIAPGVMETPMMAGMSDAVRESLAAGVPFPQRLGRPEEFASLVVHIIENDFLNGSVIRLDGALRMGSK